MKTTLIEKWSFRHTLKCRIKYDFAYFSSHYLNTYYLTPHPECSFMLSQIELLKIYKILYKRIPIAKTPGFLLITSTIHNNKLKLNSYANSTVSIKFDSIDCMENYLRDKEDKNILFFFYFVYKQTDENNQPFYILRVGRRDITQINKNKEVIMLQQP